MRIMKYTCLLFAFLLSWSWAEIDPMTKINELENKGQFKEAEHFIDQYLEEKGALLSSDLKRQIEFERERFARMRKEYDLPEESLVSSLKKYVKEFRLEEFHTWNKEGYFDSNIIDGTKYYFDSSLDNLFFRYPEIRKRSIDWKDLDAVGRSRWQHYLKVKEAAYTTSGSLVLPQRYRVRMTITVDKEAVPEGETVRCWMPYPRIFSSQTDVELIASSPEIDWMCHPESDIRSVYLEQTVDRDKPTRFEVEYEYTCYAVYQQVDPDKVLPYDADHPIYRQYTQSQPPHVVFTPELRELAGEIVGDETNPYLKTKRIYDWMAQNILYSYARDYSTLRNISQYVSEHRYGDCGQQALLFITLCRISGLAVRWQSGWMARPDSPGQHDWAEIYIEPYGWLPVDVTRGVFFYHYVNSLTEEQIQEAADFYCGGIDHFRLVANKGHNLQLYPPKRSFRSDPVDFQRGELEYDDVNLFFDQFECKLEVTAVEE